MRCEEREKITPNNSGKLSQNAFTCTQLLLLSTIKVHKKVILAFRHPLMPLLRAVNEAPPSCFVSQPLLSLTTMYVFNRKSVTGHQKMLASGFLLDSVCFPSHSLSDGLYYTKPLEEPGNDSALKGTSENTRRIIMKPLTSCSCSKRHWQTSVVEKMGE